MSSVLKSASAPTSGRITVDNAQVQLATHVRQAARFIRALDIVVLISGWVTALLILWLVGSVIDHWVWALPTAIRWIVWVLVASLTVWFLVTRLVPLVLRRINPTYAAQRIEQLVPEFKNGLIAWFELQSMPNHGVPRGVMAALSFQALRFIGGHDPASTVDSLPLIKRIGIMLLLVVALAAYAILSPKSLLESGVRMALPWLSKAAPTRVHIQEVLPGATEVTFGQPLSIQAQLRGLRAHEPVFVVFSTLDGQFTNQRIPLEATVEGLKYQGIIKSGSTGIEHDLEYWVAAGDAESSRYRVSLSPLPSMSVERVQVQFPKYTRIEPREFGSGADIEALEGSILRIWGTSNQPLERAKLVINPQLDSLGAITQAGEYLDMQVDGRTVEATCKLFPQQQSFCMKGYNTRGDSNLHPIVRPLKIVSDLPPEVMLVGPEDRLVKVATNSRLSLEIRANDADFGLAKVAVQLKSKRLNQITKVLLEQVETETTSTERPLLTRVFTLPLNIQSLGATPGERVEIVAMAWDNRHDPASQEPSPNQSQSLPLILEVVPPDEADVPPELKRQPESSPNPTKESSTEESQNGDSPPQEVGKNNEESNSSEIEPPKQPPAKQDAEQNGDQPSDNSSQPDGSSSQEQPSDHNDPSKATDSANQSGNSSKQQDKQNPSSDQDDQNGQNGRSQLSQQSQASSSESESKPGQQGQQPKQDEKSNQGKQSKQSNSTKPGEQPNQSDKAQQGDQSQQSGQSKQGDPSKTGQSSKGGEQSSSSAASSADNSGKQTTGSQRQNGSTQPRSSQGGQPDGQENGGAKSSGNTQQGQSSQKQSADGSGQSPRSAEQEAKDKETVSRIQEYMERQRDKNDAQSDNTNSDSSRPKNPPSNSDPASQQKESQKQGSNQRDSQSSSNAPGSQQPDSQQKDLGKQGQQKGADKGSQTERSQEQASQKQSSQEQGSQEQASQRQGSQGQGSQEQASQKQGSQGQGSQEQASQKQSSQGQDSQAQSAQKQDSQKQRAPQQRSEEQKSEQQKSEQQGAKQQNSEMSGQQKGDDKASQTERSQEHASQKQSSQGQGSQEQGAQKQDAQQSGAKQAGAQQQDSEKKGQQQGSQQSSQSDSAQPQPGQQESSQQKDSQQQGSQQQGTQQQGAQQQGSQKQENSQSEGAQPTGGSQKGSQSDSTNGNAPSGPPESHGQGSGGKANGGDGGSGQVGNDGRHDEYAKRSTDLTLDYLKRQREQPDPELLKELNWSENDLRKFIDRYTAAQDLSATADPIESAKEELSDLGAKSLRGSVGPGGHNDSISGQLDAGSRQRPPENLRRKVDAFQEALKRRK